MSGGETRGNQEAVASPRRKVREANMCACMCAASTHTTSFFDASDGGSGLDTRDKIFTRWIPKDAGSAANLLDSY